MSSAHETLFADGKSGVTETLYDFARRFCD